MNVPVAWETAWINAAKKLKKEGIKTKEKIIIEKPTLEGSGLSTYIVYNVVCGTDDTASNVRRRYTDFVWLRSELNANYPGLLLPALPPKISPGDAKDPLGAFVQGRMAHLQLFLESVNKIPFLFEDIAFNAFLTVPQGDSWAKKQELINAIEYDDAEKRSEGWCLWREMLDAVELPTASTLKKLIAEAKAHIGGLTGLLRNIDESWTEVNAANNTLTKRLQTMSRVTHTWRAYEVKACEKDEPSAVMKHLTGDVMARVSSTTALLVDQWNAEARHVRDMIKKEMMGCMITQNGMAQGMLEIIAYRETLMAEIEEKLKILDKKDGHIDRIQNKRLSVFDAIKGRTEESVAKSIDKHENRLKYIEESVLLLSRALWYCEIDRFGMMREVDIEKAIVSIINMNSEIAVEDAKKWSTIAESIDLGPIDYDSDSDADKVSGGCGCTIA